jgi:hypothetical protein
MLRQIAVLAVLLTLLIVAATGCDNNPEQNRTVMWVSSINGNESPLLSDVMYNDGSNSWYEPDYVEIVLANRPYNDIITTGPGQPYGDFLVTRYRVEWTRTDGGSPALPTIEIPMNVSIESGKENLADVQLVTVDNKTNAPLNALVGTAQTITMNAKITFYGHEVGVERETEVIAEIGVVFGDVINM